MRFQQQADHRTTCPQFEDLSRFVDGELGSAALERVKTHLDACGRDESILLYLASEMPRREREDLEAHLRVCDGCVSELVYLKRRLAAAEVVSQPVPAVVQERARRALEPALAELAAEFGAGPARRRRAWAERRERLASFLDLRVLVPVSMAAGALFMVAIQEVWVQPGMDRDRIRALEIEQELRVMAPEAVVRERPSRQSESLTRLGRGTVVRVTAEERGWWQVVLGDGRSGWVEAAAFE